MPLRGELLALRTMRHREPASERFRALSRTAVCIFGVTSLSSPRIGLRYPERLCS
jgi:hypothetical protein